jgi:tape measure domain-containing protein
VGSLADVYVRIRGDVTSLKEDTRKGAESAGKEAGSAFHTSFTGMIKQAAVAAGTILSGAALWNIGKIGIQAAADMQQAQVAFTTLIGNAQQAQKFLSDLKSFAAATPFELPGLVDDARLLMGVGVAANDVIPTLTAWGNAAGALGISNERFNSAMLALSQSMGAGKINAQDMNQIINAGIPVWKLMSEATGKTVPELRKLSEQGKLLSSDILPLLQAQMNKDYGGAMAAQSKTLAGVWSTLMDTFRIGLADAITPLIPTMSKLIPQAATVLSGALTAGSAAVQSFAASFGAGWHDSAAGAHDDVALLGAIVHDVFNWLKTDAIPILGALWSAFREGVAVVADITRWFMDHQKTAAALAITIGALVLVTEAHAIALALAKGELLTYLGLQSIVTAATKTWTAVQWLLNIAMDANPIGLIVLAIGILVVAFVLLWNNSEGFRKFFINLWADIWNVLKAIGAWFAGPFVNFFVTAGRAIAAPFIWVWQNGILPMWDGMKAVGAWFAGPFVNFFVVAGKAVAAPFIWLWHNVMEPVWDGIKIAVALADRIMTSAFNLWAYIIRNTVGVAVLWLWHNVFEPALQGIAALGVWLWNNALKPAFDGIVIAGKAVGDFFVWLWHNAVEPAAQGIASAAQWLWNSVLVPAFNGIVSAGRAVGSFFTWLWQNAIMPAIHGVADVISWVWNSVIHPTFDAVMDKVHMMQDVFRLVFGAIAGFISSAFAGAVSIVKGAINGIIGVINGAIGGVNSIINKVNEVPGVNFPHIPTIPKLATGGLITKGGRVMVGEVGAEVVDLPPGAAVYPHGSVPRDDNSPEIEALLRAILDAIEGVAPGVGEAINGTGTQLRRLARAGV